MPDQRSELERQLCQPPLSMLVAMPVTTTIHNGQRGRWWVLGALDSLQIHLGHQAGGHAIPERNTGILQEQLNCCSSARDDIPRGAPFREVH